MAQGLSDRAAAKSAGCSHTAIAKAKANGRLPALPDGSVSPAALEKWNADRSPSRGGKQLRVAAKVAASIPLVAHAGETAAQAIERIIAASGIPEHDRAEAERIRENYNALLRQLEYDTKSALVVSAAEVAAMVGAEYAQVRTKMLAIPAEQAPRLHRLKTVTEIQDALMAMIVEALEGLTRDGPAASA